MKNIALLAALLAGPVAAQSTQQPSNAGMTAPLAVDGAAMQALTSLAAGQKTGDDTFDGMPVLRREGPLVILAEDKDVLLRQYERSGSSTYYGGGYHGGYGHPYYGPGWGWGYGGGVWTHEPPATVKVYGTRQKVGIADRPAYVRSQAKRGAKRGMLAGILFGLLGLAIAGPVGLAVGFGASTAVGAISGDVKARKAPRVFERGIEERAEVIPH